VARTGLRGRLGEAAPVGLCHAGVLIEVEDRAPIDRARPDRGCAFPQCNRRSDKRIADKLTISATLLWPADSSKLSRTPIS